MSLRQYRSIYFHKPLEVWNTTRLDDILESFMEERRHIYCYCAECVRLIGPDKDPLYEVVGEVFSVCGSTLRGCV